MPFHRTIRRIPQLIASRGKGFALIELMIVVAIIAILAAIALPSYSRYVYRSRRASAHDILMGWAAAEERYFTNFNRYALTVGDLGMTGQTTSEGGYYTASVAAGGTGDNQSYQLTATPTGVQANDSCGALGLDSQGTKTAPSDDGTNGACW
jgi:type IV pilus assembly protein PilE